MAIVREIYVGGKVLKMRASALIPRLYRVKFGRDLIRDMKALEGNFREAKENPDRCLSAMDLTLFENIAWVMAKHADPEVPSDPDEWLDGFDSVLSVYEVLPEILALWSDNLATTSIPAKK